MNKFKPQDLSNWQFLEFSGSRMLLFTAKSSQQQIACMYSGLSHLKKLSCCGFGLHMGGGNSESKSTSTSRTLELETDFIFPGKSWTLPAITSQPSILQLQMSTDCRELFLWLDPVLQDRILNLQICILFFSLFCLLFTFRWWRCLLILQFDAQPIASEIRLQKIHRFSQNLQLCYKPYSWDLCFI